MVEITKVNPTTFELQTYEPQDENLISTSSIDTEFVSLESSIEFFIYDLNNNITETNEDFEDNDEPLINRNDPKNKIKSKTFV